MVNQEFRIDVVVDPAKARPGTEQVGRRLDAVEKQAAELRRELVRALSVRDQGVSQALQGINATLERTEQQALITDARLGQIGRDIRGEGLDLIQDELDETERRGISVGATLRRVFAGIGIAFATRQLIGFADEATRLRNQLSVVADDQSLVNQQFDDLAQIANETRTGLEGIVTLYQRGSAAADELGASNQQLLQFVERVGQGLAVQGTSATQAQGALLQLSQALGAGVVRAEEFNSILEGARPIAVAAARGIDRAGGSVSRLRQLIIAGEITSKEFFEGFLEGSDELEEAFGRSSATVGQGLTVLRNNAVAFIGALDESTGITRLLANGLIVLGENLDIVAISVGVLSTALLVNFAGTAIPAAIAGLAGLKAAQLAVVPAFAAATAAVGFFAKTISDTRADIEALQETTRQLEEDTQFGDERFRSIQRAQREINNINRAIEAQQRRGSEASESQLQTIERLQNAIRELRGEADRDRMAQEEAAVARKLNSDEITKVIEGLQEEGRLLALNSQEQAIQREILDQVAQLKKQDIDLTDESLAAKREEIEALIRGNAETARLQQVLDRVTGGPGAKYKQLLMDLQTLLDQGRISQEEFNAAAERFRPRTRTTEEANPFAEQLKSLREQNEELEIRANNFGIQEQALLIEAELRRNNVTLTREEQDELAGLLLRQQELNQELERQKTEEQEIAKAKRDAARESEREQNRIDNLRAQIDVIGTLQEQQEELNRLFGQEEEIAGQVQRAIEDLRLRQLDASNELAAGFERAFIRIKREAEDLASVGEDVVNVFADRATDAIVEFARTGQFSFKQFANAVLDDLIRILARLLVVQAISAAIGGGGAILGSALGGAAGGGLNAGRQGGGTVQPGQQPFPVGEAGPELFVPNQTGTIVPNQASVPQPAPQVNLQLVTVQSEDQVPEAIASGSATEAIIQEIGNNKDRVNSVLGR